MMATGSLDEKLGPPLLIVDDEEQIPRTTRIELVPAGGMTITCAHDVSDPDAPRKVVTLTAGGVGAVNTGNIAVGVIHPSITADQNNWAPAGLTANTDVIRVTTDASRTITGLALAVLADERLRVLIINVGSFNLVLAHESGSSSVANRFLIPGAANLTLLPNDSCDVWFDDTTNRVRVV